MQLFIALVLVSSLSFLGYCLAYFTSPHMKEEFRRFGLEKVGLVAIIFELLGAVGLLVGLKVYPILLISSGGLALLMFLGVIFRLRAKDGLLVSLPALFFMLLNAGIFVWALKKPGVTQVAGEIKVDHAYAEGKGRATRTIFREVV